MNYTKEEDDFIRKHYAEKGAKWCADRMEWRSVDGVRKHAKDLGVSKNRWAVKRVERPEDMWSREVMSVASMRWV
jgi:hypothetical protein